MKLVRYNQTAGRPNEWNTLFSDPFSVFAPLFGDTRRSTSSASAPSSVSWFEDDDNYYARVEMPGVKKENLKLDAEEGFLNLSHESVKSECENSGKCEASRFSRTLRVPEKTDLSGIGAKLEDGILSLTIPKAEERKPVSIQIS